MTKKICPCKCGILLNFSMAKLFVEKLTCQLFSSSETLLYCYIYIGSNIRVNDVTKWFSTSDSALISVPNNKLFSICTNTFIWRKMCKRNFARVEYALQKSHVKLYLSVCIKSYRLHTQCKYSQSKCNKYV